MELWGEDALLQWPGARRALIHERDAYMARTIWAAASGDALSVAEGQAVILPCVAMRLLTLQAHTLGWRLECTTLLLDSPIMAGGCMLVASCSLLIQE